MTEKKPQRGGGAPIWGIFLLFSGVLLLLQTFGILPWGLWGSLWRFWPVLIIIIGLGILLRRYHVWLVSLLILAILGTCLGIAVWQYGLSSPPGTVTKSYSEPLGDMKRAQIEVDFTAGDVTIGSLPANSPNFVEAASEVGSVAESMNLDFHRQDSEGRLYLSTDRVDWRLWGEGKISWEVNFTRSIPLTLNIKSAASNMELDLGKLKVTELRLDVDAGNYKVIVPSSAGTTNIEVEADVVNMEVNIPDGVAARIQADTGLGAFIVDTTRFPKQGDYYISENFNTAQNRIYLEIDCNVGRVRVK